ncbi:hypothetical protein UlMin_012107 [Ulmus minor]
MLPKFRSPFKKLEEKAYKDSHGSRERSVAEGLQIAVQLSSQGLSKSNIVVKSGLKLNQPKTRSSSIDSCFLKTCNLCNKRLSLDKEVYMYRGDQGFCSVECRERHIFVEEMRELEASTKQMVASYRKQCKSSRDETGLLLEDLPHKNNNYLISQPRNRAVVFS